MITFVGKPMDGAAACERTWIAGDKRAAVEVEGVGGAVEGSKKRAAVLHLYRTFGSLQKGLLWDLTWGLNQNEISLLKGMEYLAL